MGVIMRSQFQAGGPLTETAVYVERGADRALRDCFEKGEFCYVLASRQVGKTSLVTNIASWFREQKKSEIRVVDVDLSTIGSNVSEAEWFFTLSYQIAKELECEDELPTFWSDAAGQSPASRWTQFLESYLPKRVTGKLVIVLDEVSVVQALPFSCDALFATIRSAGESGRESSAPLGLSFCLIGVAMLSDLLRDPALAPFNAREVSLDDFSRDELLDGFLPLLAEHVGDEAKLFLDAIFEWTNGHPYMTQRLCAQLVEHRREAKETPGALIKRLVEDAFLRNGRIQDAVLNYVERSVSKDQVRFPQDTMLDLYRNVLAKTQVPSEPGRPAEAYLKLCGLVRVVEASGKPILMPRNRIFATVFDLRWVHEKETELYLGGPLQDWQRAIESEKANHLLRGAKLKRALRWADTHHTSPDESKFLLDSESAALESERAARERVEEQDRLKEAEFERTKLRQRFRITQLAIFAALSVVGLLVYGYARERERDSRLIQTLGNSASHSSEEILVALIKLQAESPAAVEARPALIRGLTEAMDMQTSVPLLGHGARLTSVVTSPDGERVLTGAEDGTARLWTTKTGASIALEGHDGAATTVAFSSDGALAATGDKKGIVRLWDGKTGKALKELAGHTKMVTVVAFSTGPDGKACLASTSDDGTVIFRRAADWDRAEKGVQKGEINAGAFSRDGRWFATAGESGTVFVWRVADAGVERTLTAERILRAVAFSPDGSLVAAGGADGATRVWQTKDGELRHTLRNGDNPEQIWSIAFSHGGDKLVTVGLGNKSILWDTNTGAPRAMLVVHYEGINTLKAAFSPDDKQVATVSSEGSVRIWSAVTGALVARRHEHENQTVDLAFSGDGRYLITASWDGTARIWNTRDTRPLVELSASDKPLEAPAPLGALAYSPDGQRIAAAGDDGHVRLWTTKGGSPIELDRHQRTVNWVAFSPGEGTRYLASAGDDQKAHVYDAASGRLLDTLSHGGPVRKVVFSKNGALIATAGKDGLVKIWRNEGEKWAEIAAHGPMGDVRDIAFSPDGTRLLSGGQDTIARLWPTTGGGPPIELRGHKALIRSVTFSPDGRTVATASNDRTARLWDATTGKELRTLEGHSFNILQVMFLPDGKHVVTAGWDLSARIWDASTGKLLFRLNHTGPVTSLASSKDGRTLATTSADGFLWLWDTGDHLGDLLAKLPGATGQVWQAAFSPDGRRVATVNEDGRLRVYAATLEGFLAQACRMLEPRPAFARVKDACVPHLRSEP